MMSRVVGSDMSAWTHSSGHYHLLIDFLFLVVTKSGNKKGLNHVIENDKIEDANPQSSVTFFLFAFYFREWWRVSRKESSFSLREHGSLLEHVIARAC